MCGCVCIRARAHIYAQVRIRMYFTDTLGVWKPESGTGCPPPLLSALSFETGSFVEPGSRLAVQKVSGMPLLLLLPSAGIPGKSGSSYGCWGLNSGFYAYMAGALTAESQSPLGGSMKVLRMLYTALCIAHFLVEFYKT